MFNVMKSGSCSDGADDSSITSSGLSCRVSDSVYAWLSCKDDTLSFF